MSRPDAQRAVYKEGLTVRVLIATIGTISGIIYCTIYYYPYPALAETLTCSTWQGIRTCPDSHGYTSHETQWQGMTIGQDSDGNRWDHEPLARL